MREADDPLDPKRWSSSGDGGRISGDDYAYLKDLIHHRVGVGNRDSEWCGDRYQVPQKPPEPTAKKPWWRCWIRD